MLLSADLINKLRRWRAGERTDESAKVRVEGQDTALTSRCGAVGRANTQH